MISLQGNFNARVGEKIGFWQTNTFVHVTGLMLALILLVFLGNFNFSNVKEVSPVYLLGGVLGVLIVFSVMKGITNLGASYAVTIVLATQIIITCLINMFGIFGESVIQYFVIKYVGLILMTIGLLIFQLCG